MSEHSEDLWSSLPEALQEEILGRCSFADLARASLVCRSIRDQAEQIQRVPCWRSWSYEGTPIDTNRVDEYARTIVSKVAMPQRPDLVILFYAPNIILQPESDEGEEDASASRASLLFDALISLLPPTTTVIAAPSGGILGSSDEGPVEADPADETAFLTVSFVALGDSVRHAPFAVVQTGDRAAAACPFSKQYTLQGALPMASEMEGGGVAALVVSSSHVPLRKAAGILRERFGTAFAPVGGIASCEEGAPMLLARGRPFAPAGGQDGLPSVMRDSSQSSTFGVLLWGPGLVASTMTIRGFRQIGPVHTVERATHSVGQRHGSMGHVTSSIVTAVKEADAPCDAPLIAPMAMFHNKDVQEAVMAHMESGEGLMAMLGLISEDGGGSVKYEMHHIQAGSHGDEEGLLVSREGDDAGVKAGDRVCLLAMTAQSNREELAARLKECTVSGDAAGLLGFVCAGRGSSLYGEAGVESKIITEVFPSLPFSGMFAGGELGPPAHYEVVDSSEPSSLMGFTSVYCHLALHKGRRPAQ